MDGLFYCGRQLDIPKEISEAHEQGIIHFHDSDYFIQHMFNCCLLNLDDMLQNGTVISGTKIEKPHSFSTACNIATLMKNPPILWIGIFKTVIAADCSRFLGMKKHPVETGCFAIRQRKRASTLSSISQNMADKISEIEAYQRDLDATKAGLAEAKAKNLVVFHVFFCLAILDQNDRVMENFKRLVDEV